MRYRPRRRVLVVNKVEDRIPGRLAYVVHVGRNTSRARSLAAYRSLRRWAEHRQQQLAAEQRGGSAEGEIDLTENAGSPENANANTEPPTAPLPDDTWTKGELYEMARELDIDGRSKLNKADLLDALLEVLDDDESAQPSDSDSVDLRADTAGAPASPR